MVPRRAALGKFWYCVEISSPVSPRKFGSAGRLRLLSLGFSWSPGMGTVIVTPRRFRWLPLTDDVDDFSGRLLHVQDDGVDPADEVIVSSIARNGHRQTGGSADKGLPDAPGEILHIRQG